MGHVRRGVLSRAKKWDRVVEDLHLGADVDALRPPPLKRLRLVCRTRPATTRSSTHSGC